MDDDFMINIDLEDLIDFSGLEEFKKSLEPLSDLLASLVVDDDLKQRLDLSADLEEVLKPQ
ncbi:hypothetical protein Q5O24_12470 [Eubacteriaceae bacterium ES3]|nr:hypothetical protein Q5O24_12470 [Eubacteriaceae bacterium ES3]